MNGEDAVTQTEGTPPARWRAESDPNSLQFGYLFTPEGDNTYVDVLGGLESDRILTALNETEALRERLRLAEAALRGLLAHSGHMKRREESNVDARYVRKMLARLGPDVYDPTGEVRAVLEAEDFLRTGADAAPPQEGE